MSNLKHKDLKSKFSKIGIAIGIVLIVLVVISRNSQPQLINEMTNQTQDLQNQLPKLNTGGFYLEEKHTIKGDLTFEQKLPKDNGPIHPGGWTTRYWKGSDPLVILVIPSDQTIEGALSSLDFKAYKGQLPFLKGSKDYGDTKVTVEIFKDPLFLDPAYYNKVVGTEEYCQKIQGVYTNDHGNYKHKSLGKWSCPNNYTDIKQ